MRKATLTRKETSDQGTFGTITAEGLTLFTGELPWRNNDNNFSCIPAGTYKASFTYSPRFKRKMYLIEPVDGRTGIRIHSANRVGDKAKGFVAELLGCIALGEKLGWINNQKAILVSGPAVRRFETLMKNETFILEVIDV